MSGKNQALKSHSERRICALEKDQKCKVPLKFWEIEICFKCPVVGMCLTDLEQKQLLKKTGVAVKHKSDFEIHEALVASAESDNRISRKVDHLLNRKFGKEATALLELDSQAFKAHFKAVFENGDGIGVLWAAAVNPELPTKIKRDIFGDIHMAMHWNAKQSLKLKQKSARQRHEIDELHERLKDAIRLRRILKKENKHLNKALVEMKSGLSAVEEENSKLTEQVAYLNNRHQFADMDKENRLLKKKLEAMEANSQQTQRQMAALQEKNLRLSADIAQQRESVRCIKEEAQTIIGEAFVLNRCDATCPSFDLCKKRILIVGGFSRMESLYRELIEGNGGVFEYHDGYVKKGVKALENRLKRSDVVICPVSCNSHTACAVIKNLGKKYKKAVYMLPNSSLSTVSRVIWANENTGSTQN